MPLPPLIPPLDPRDVYLETYTNGTTAHMTLVHNPTGQVVKARVDLITESQFQARADLMSQLTVKVHAYREEQQ